MATIQIIPDLGALISHQKFLEQLYGQEFIMKDLFDIKTPFMMDEQARATITAASKKRKKRQEFLPSKLELKMLELLKKLEFEQPPTKEDVLENNKKLRLKASEVMNKAVMNYKSLSGGNSSDKVMHKGDYVLPPNCRFFSVDVSKKVFENETNFKAILMDPPWTNKHVKRRKNNSDSYQMLSNQEIFDNLPQFDSILDENGLLIIWCTAKVLDTVKYWIENWNLEIKATWYWLKLTKSGQTVTNWNHPHKKPYEPLIIAGHPKSQIQVENEWILASVPSGIHSHKPPLWPILRDMNLLGDKDECLEIFGRYLLPFTTTFGNQCLLFQSKNVFFK